MARQLVGIVFALILAPAAVASDDPQQLVHALDYLQVDYPEAVRDGRVINDAEFAEMREFAATVREALPRLPQREGREGLISRADELREAIDARAERERIAELAGGLKRGLIETYGVTVAPRRPPDVSRGQTLYQANCVQCHGAEGRGDGPLASELTPPPTDFRDMARAGQQSVHGLYNTITLGVDGTAMEAYDDLPAADRWALAFYVGTLAFSPSQEQRGERLWADGSLHDAFPSLEAVTTAAPNEIRDRHGDQGVAVLAHLRSEPGVAVGGPGGPLEHAREVLAQSVAEYRAEAPDAAYRLALEAYLEGFELVEGSLDATAPDLRRRAETEMAKYRELIQGDAPVVEVEAQAETVASLIDEAESTLRDTRMEPALSFVSAFVILVREGVEAIIVLAAMGAFLVRAGRRDALRYVHGGWIAALVAGLATWVIASTVISISGAGREISEGVAALLAAAVLFYVGAWLHDKSHAQRWQEFIREKLQGTLSHGGLWLLAGIAFIAVYREAFETVLFYQALWLQSADTARTMVIAGFGAGAVVLVGLAWAILRASMRLPIKAFFRVNAFLMYALAIVFAGKGIAALQEAGKLPVDTIAFPRIDILGIYPNLQSLGLQAILIAVALATWIRVRRHDQGAAAQ